ncbi:HAMP domain-containing sensor histidine kinase [Candidatus Formimonas warabiya]|uniref:histidine kinase n=1 Tax=Formimonas warabiya TaxID=1761012 RepID=A0A3G1KTL2_FORW1|nr:HAMP domain-containing sensor histidine kinase [Candidatus Formimonas warabiya]ATW25770.1 two-component sensor histidine kinase [Candidatus Formimonas warabiya]
MKGLGKIIATAVRALVTGIISLCFLAAGYGCAELLFSVTGRPAPFWAYIVSGIFGLLVFAGTVNLIFVVIHKVFNRRHGDQRMDFYHHVTGALKKIAQGNFDVFIPSADSDRRGNVYFNEIAESVNKMAKELSSMEKLRQDFISNVSHEIQSPLTSISGFAALLKNEALSPEQRSHYLDIIETESKRLSKLSDNLLKLSALEADQTSFTPHEFRLDKQIESCVLMLEPQWREKNIRLDLALAKVIFLGDEELLTQVWVNLLHNAVKFTPADGCIGIALTENENAVCCTISDNGIGIPEEDQIHIFERFYKVDKSRDRSFGGNGLGLSLVKKIVDIHHGQISMISAVGKGTEFAITLPR